MKKHRSFKPEQKARAVLQVLTGQKSAAQICRELQINESLLSRWKKQFLNGASAVFEKESDPAQDGERVAELERLVGRLTLELEAAKKASHCCARQRFKRRHFIF
jgi:transposase